MKKFYLLLLFLPIFGQAQTLPVITVTGGPCAGSTLTVNSSIKPARIVWKLNGNAVQTVNATWDPSGITVAGGNGAGTALNQIDQPSYLYVDTLGSVFVSDYNNNRVMKWAAGATAGTVVAGGNGAGSALNQTSGPSGLWLDPQGNIFVSEYNNARVTKWAPGGTAGTVAAGGNGSGSAANQLEAVQGIYVAPNDTVYIADFNNNRIQKWAPNATTGTTVAGGNGQGNGANQLYAPEGVFVDKYKNTFVADFVNYRVQEYVFGATNGTTVAGGNGNGNGANQSFPDDVVTDGLGNIYVSSDDNSYRIQQWVPGATTGTNIAGGNGYGTANNQFKTNIALFQDDSGNVYVSDLGNDRVQKFLSQIIDTYSVTTTGDYTVVVYDFNGDSVVENINAPVPTVTITATPGVNISLGQSVTFAATGTNGGNTPAYQWYKNSQSIANATNNTYTSNTLADGDQIKVVMHSSDTCVTPDSAVSNILTMHVTSGIGFLNGGDMAIYPNPNNGSFTIQGTYSGTETLQADVLNITGQVIYHDDIPVNNNVVNKQVLLSTDIPKGVYLLQLHAGKQTSTMRFSIN